mgnify:CR=1 FL=1
MDVMIALSGGVDSAVAARRLRDEDPRVRAVTMRLTEASGGEAEAPEASRAEAEAAEVARRLGLDHQVVDLRAAFATKVIAAFQDAYRRGLTPNPCVRCNQEVKFGLLLDWALSHGAGVLATGHYARRETRDGAGALFRPRDTDKDQTYFLSRVPGERLARTRFPLGDALKGDVEAEAASLGIRPFRSSREICFVPGQDHMAFLRCRMPEAFRPGEILDRQGRVLGEHRGLPAYTVGQRRGLGIGASRPLYVIRLDAAANRVIVGPEEALWKRTVRVGGINRLGPLPADGGIQAQIRYRQPAVPARFVPSGETEAEIRFERPVRAAAPGQTAAWYLGDRLLGGGEILAEDA